MQFRKQVVKRYLAHKDRSLSDTASLSLNTIKLFHRNRESILAFADGRKTVRAGEFPAPESDLLSIVHTACKTQSGTHLQRGRASVFLPVITEHYEPVS